MKKETEKLLIETAEQVSANGDHFHAAAIYQLLAISCTRSGSVKAAADYLSAEATKAIQADAASLPSAN